jgi:hypothetical protein
MRMLQARAIPCRLTWRGILLFAIFLLALHLLFANLTFSQPQPRVIPTILITPSATTMLVGETSTLSAVDETGRPMANVQWSINSDVVTLQEQDGEVFLQGRAPGQAVLTATANHKSDTAVISVLAGQKLAPPTVRWSLHPMPGFETLLVIQAVAADKAPAFYSVEWSKSENAIVRALRSSGEQLWMTHLSSSASPSTLKHTLPVTGEVFENGALVSDQALFIIGVNKAFTSTAPADPSALGLPPDGKSLLVHATGDAVGGILLLERGRFRDSLVDLNPATGSELWRYRSAGRLAADWTANGNMDVGIVETLSKPVSSGLLVLNAGTGQVGSRIPLPVSSSTIDGFRCTDPQRNILKSLRASPAGSVLTSSDGNMYVQVETHVESLLVEHCQSKHYSFNDSLALQRNPRRRGRMENISAHPCRRRRRICRPVQGVRGRDDTRRL